MLTENLQVTVALAFQLIHPHYMPLYLFTYMDIKTRELFAINGGVQVSGMKVADMDNGSIRCCSHLSSAGHRYVYIYIHMYIYIHTCIYIYMCIYTHISSVVQVR